MLKIFHSFQDADIGKLVAVYEQSNIESGALNYPNFLSNLQILYAEQDMYAYLKLFFKQPQSFYAIWDVEGEYMAALRVEPYDDGVIFAGLETKPAARGNGYATNLVRTTVQHCGNIGIHKIYSHVDKKNTISLAVHRACGFERIGETAAYVDKSIVPSSCTLYIKL